jgi:hypothetical protein
MAGGVLTVSPLADATNYDIITIAGITTATATHGVVKVSGAERKYDWDEKKSAGSQGQTITYRGWGLAKPKIKFQFWLDAQIRAFYDQLQAPMSYDAQKTAPKPWDVYHPQLFASQIYWLVTTNIGELLQEGAQLWSVTVETLEFRQPTSKNATATPQQSNNSENGGETKPTQAQKLQQEIEKERALWNLPVGGANQNRQNQ